MKSIIDLARPLQKHCPFHKRKASQRARNEHRDMESYSTAERPLNPHTHSYTEASHSPSPSSSTSLCSSPSLASSTSPTPFPSLASSPVIPSEPYYSTNATSPSIPDSPSFTSYSIPTTPVESDPVHEYRPRVQPLAVTFGPTQLRSAIRMAKEARRMQYEMERRERFNSVAYEGDEEGEGKRSEWRRLSTVEESEYVKLPFERSLNR